MARSKHPCSRFVLALALAAAGPAVTAAQDAGVLIAVDSSRSLTASQSRAATELARELLVRLGATTRPSVLTFDDSVHWLAADEAGADAALEALQPVGRFTVLNDGLIEGVRALADGGVVIVISDGKDENSATTLEDVARLASERDVRIVTLGVGRVDERAMKRLALLTGGLYAGVAAGVGPDALAAEIEALRREVEAARAPAPAPEPAPPPVEAAAAPSAAPVAPPPAEGSRLLLLLGALVALAGILVGFLLARRRAPARGGEREADVTTKPGVPEPEPAPVRAAGPTPDEVDEIQSARLKGWPPVPGGGLMEVSLDDTAAFQSLPLSESIERTLVLNEEVVLTVHEPGQEPVSYRIPPGRAVDIGRDAKGNTLAFPDPTMSMQHLRLALEEGQVYLVDQGSTNGILIQGRRVDSAVLHPGDRFRAGMIEFGLDLRRASSN